MAEEDLMFCPCGPKSSKGQVADSMIGNSTSSGGSMKSLDDIKVSESADRHVKYQYLVRTF